MRRNTHRGKGGRFAAKGRRYNVWADTTLLFHLWVDGEAKPWCAPKMARFGGEVPTPRRTAMKEWQASIMAAYEREKDLKRNLPLDGPLSCRLMFVLPRPYSRRKAEVWAETYADVDNMAKAVHDALQRAGVLVNDSRIVELYAAKIWTPHASRNALPPGVRIELRRPPAALDETYLRNERVA